ncbi:NitT/TauT family transport system ATP-binding protein [Thalassovita litoralis]|uniref:NitT/TauT family transport system ATP-binding protein n=1 Tax=Thalassovita litoralis TaxID=1010611 RepID=A0A521CFC7_9RHOB|nr:CmpA/NrtA family ABC transporter substrate-binding protein [Thalassovita litoralis]SMO57460.1 NitT/TauT family transport system ATP-binding protein [Thalassovita litoralis]
MRQTQISVGFIPLVDAAPLVVAHEMGFAAEEGIALDLRRAPSWSSIRDMLSFGQVDAAHMLAPMPVATALGLGGGMTPVVAGSVLSVNGTVIGVNTQIAARLRSAGHNFAFDDAYSAGAALIAATPDGLRIGVPFPFSMQRALVEYWLGTIGHAVREKVTIHTVPPPLMVDAIEAGEIDAFCVGEPWGSMAVEKGVATLLLPGAAIWKFAPEKILAVRSTWAETESVLLGRLIRAVWRAGRWLAEPASQSLAAELLSRQRYLDLSPEIIERALTGRLVISSRGEERQVPQFLEFFDGVATFPWRSQGEWIGRHLAQQHQLDVTASATAGGAVFRTDLYRAALGRTSAILPVESSKPEGGMPEVSSVPGMTGHVSLKPDTFFDGTVFEPIQDNR